MFRASEKLDKNYYSINLTDDKVSVTCWNILTQTMKKKEATHYVYWTRTSSGQVSYDLSVTRKVGSSVINTAEPLREEVGMDGSTKHATVL